MNKYIVVTETKVLKKYYLTYELKLDHCPTEDDIDGFVPTDEEYVEEETIEEIISVENLGVVNES